MSRSFKALMLASCLFAIFFASSNFNSLEAAYGRWGAYNNERAAWGGNGGWWGNGNSDWYGDRGWPESNNYYSDHYNPYYGGDEAYNYNGYYYNNNYPSYGQYYYGDGGIGAGADVAGAGLYFNVR